MFNSRAGHPWWKSKKQRKEIDEHRSVHTHTRILLTSFRFRFISMSRMSDGRGKYNEIVKYITQPCVGRCSAVKGTVRNKGSSRRKYFHTLLCHTMFRATRATKRQRRTVPTQLRYLNVAPRSVAFGGNERNFYLVQTLREQLLPRVRKSCRYTHTHNYVQQNRVVTPRDVFD